MFAHAEMLRHHQNKLRAEEEINTFEIYHLIAEHREVLHLPPLFLDAFGLADGEENRRLCLLSSSDSSSTSICIMSTMSMPMLSKFSICFSYSCSSSLTVLNSS